MVEGAKGALVTEGIFGFAVIFPDGDEEGVEFVVEVNLGGKVGFEGVLDGLVIVIRGDEEVSEEDSVGVGIDDEGGLLGGVEEDIVGGFRSDAVDDEEFLSEAGGGLVKEAVEVSFVLVMDMSKEVEESFGFDGEVPCGADKLGEFIRWGPDEFFDIHQVGLFEVFDGSFDVFPIGILGEDGADHDFEGGIAGPPVLGAEGLEHGLKEVY
jgi:hypothetical protein